MLPGRKVGQGGGRWGGSAWRRGTRWWRRSESDMGRQHAPEKSRILDELVAVPGYAEATSLAGHKIDEAMRWSLAVASGVGSGVLQPARARGHFRAYVRSAG
jgi:hypothetical protein